MMSTNHSRLFVAGLAVLLALAVLPAGGLAFAQDADGSTDSCDRRIVRTYEVGPDTWTDGEQSPGPGSPPGPVLEEQDPTGLSADGWLNVNGAILHEANLGCDVSRVESVRVWIDHLAPYAVCVDADKDGFCDQETSYSCLQGITRSLSPSSPSQILVVVGGEVARASVVDCPIGSGLVNPTGEIEVRLTYQ